MSATATASQTTVSRAAPDAWPGYQPDLGLMCTVADLLIPLFTSATIGVKFAQAVARSALDEYRPETGADYVNAARTLAFSIAALTLLGHAAEQDMTMPEKIRTFGHANALNRSADQSERTMMQRRRCQSAWAEQPPSTAHASRPPAPLSAPDPLSAPAPLSAKEEAEVEAAVAKAVAACASAFANPDPEPYPAPKRAEPTLSAVPSSVPASSIHYPAPRPANPPPARQQPPSRSARPNDFRKQELAAASTR